MSLICWSSGEWRPENSLHYNDLVQTVFFPVYPVIAHQILKKANIDYGHCLDIGCGPGNLSLSLATFSDLKVFAMENSRNMCRIAKENIQKYRLEARIKPVFGHPEMIPFEDACMDLVVSGGSFFFWKNLPQGFAECRRVLRPGGMAYLGGGFGTGELRDTIASRMRSLDPLWDTACDDAYARCNPHQVRSSLAAAGVFEYDLILDDSGYWVVFTRE
jgi:ubiquinone/menaquinone biosynthesis C-methylase UbiE